jgi:phage terminase large subunit-like protein
VDFDIDLLPWQQEVWNDPSRFKVVAAGRRTGKSRLAAYMLLVKGLQTTEGEIFYVAPTQGQARDILWNLLMELGQGVIESSHINNMQVKLVNGTQISLKGSDRPETLRGNKVAFVAIDEYADMRESVWELVLRPALTDLAPNSSALFIGTPTGRNHFYELYKKAMDMDDYAAFHFTSYDNNLLDKKEINAAKKQMSSFGFRQEYMASFEARGSEMFKEDWVSFDTKEPTIGDYYVSVDLAGFAEVGQSRRKKKTNLDSTAIAVVKVSQSGWWVKDIISGRWDLNETAMKIFQVVRDNQPLAVGIERGIAKQAVMSPLSDLMRQHARYFRIQELTHGNKNKTDRIMWALQGRFENGMIKLNKGAWNDKFLDELYQFPDALTHDDCVDALAYVDQMANIVYVDEVFEDNYVPMDSVAGY